MATALMGMTMERKTSISTRKLKPSTNAKTIGVYLSVISKTSAVTAETYRRRRHLPVCPIEGSGNVHVTQTVHRVHRGLAARLAVEYNRQQREVSRVVGRPHHKRVAQRIRRQHLVRGSSPRRAIASAFIEFFHPRAVHVAVHHNLRGVDQPE